MEDVNMFLMFIIVKVWFNWDDKRVYDFVRVVKSEGRPGEEKNCWWQDEYGMGISLSSEKLANSKFVSWKYKITQFYVE